MSVWYCIPSARPDGGTIPLWRERGYKVACWRDLGAPPIEADMVLIGEYPGYAVAVNTLVQNVLERHPETEWLVTGGDDVQPDLNHTPEEIAEQCSVHFQACDWDLVRTNTFGVMQPTGGGHGIETICGSPWMGRSFCERINGGNGPLWHQYTHNFVDNELQEVAKRLKVLWQRPDLTHQHNNWMWTTGARPAFLDEAYSKAHWDKYSELFFRRRATGFPGHEPIHSACLVGQ